MLLLRFLWQQLQSAASHPSRESCRMDGNLWWTVAVSHVADAIVCRAFPSVLELSLNALHILQLQKNKKAHRIVAIKALAGYIIYKCPQALYCLYLKHPGILRRNSSTPLSRSLIKTAKIPAPAPASRWELARVQVLWDTVEGQGQVCAGNCTADTALLRMSLDPSITFNSLSLCPSLIL